MSRFADSALCTVTSQNEKTTLLGKTKQDYASILKWMSFANSEVLVSLAGWFRPLIGRDPYNKKSVEDSQKATLAKMKVIEDHLLVNTYLVGERLTLADIFMTSMLGRGFEHFFDKKWRADFPCVTRWYETIYNQPIFSSVSEPLKFIDVGKENKPPAKAAESKPKEQPKKQEKKKEAEDDDEEEEAKPAPKPKHPLEALPKPTFVLDDW